MFYASRFLRYDDENFMQGPDVLLLQEKLVKKGYRISTSGIYDKSTEEAVTNFQQFSGLRADGIVGPATWNLLGLGDDNHLTAEDALVTRPSILINLDKRRLTFTLDGSSTTYPVAVGKPSTPQPYRQLDNCPEISRSRWTFWRSLDEIIGSLGKLWYSWYQ